MAWGVAEIVSGLEIDLDLAVDLAIGREPDLG
jgi:hypothetical protein